MSSTPPPPADGGRPPERRGRPSLIIITADCLRRDRVSAYGYERKTTPFLDSTLERSIHCTSAHSTSSWTCPSVASLLTGLYPHHHRGGLVPGELKNLSKDNLPTLLPVAVPSLPRTLASAGYADAAMAAVWNAHLAIPGLFHQMSMVERSSARLMRLAIRWIAQQDGPFFLWLHLGDTHEPLRVPRRLRHVFGRVPRIPSVKGWKYTKDHSDVGSPAFERYREARIRLYDAATRGVDASIEWLWRRLGELAIADRTILVVTSDHGEEFWEHRDDEMAFADPRDIHGTGHGHNLFQVHLLVPLLISGPGIDARQVDLNVSLADVVPTLLQALDIAAPPCDGRSLLEPLESRPILAEAVAYGHEKKTVVLEDLKLLSSPGDGYERMFRLGSDRREVETLEDPKAAARLRAALPGDDSELGEQVEATGPILSHLRELGYIE